jgi:hypothetical protein
MISNIIDVNLTSNVQNGIIKFSFDSQSGGINMNFEIAMAIQKACTGEQVELKKASLLNMLLN